MLSLPPSWSLGDQYDQSIPLGLIQASSRQYRKSAMPLIFFVDQLIQAAGSLIGLKIFHPCEGPA